MMVQQPSKRSYNYFLSFAKGQKNRHSNSRGRPPQRRRGSNVSKARSSKRTLQPRPAWDSTIHDLSVWKLTPTELEAKEKALKSRFHDCSTTSSVTSTGLSSPPSLDPGDRSELSEQEGKAELPIRLAQVSPSSKITVRNQVQSAGSSKEGFKSLDLKLSANGVSKGFCPSKRLKNGGAISRFGKENKNVRCLPNAIETAREGDKSTLTSTGIRTNAAVIDSGREITLSSASRGYNSTAHAPRAPRAQLFLQSPNQKASSETVQNTKQSTHGSVTTVDFDGEVKQFEAEKKNQQWRSDVCLVTRQRHTVSYQSPRKAAVGKKRCYSIEGRKGSSLTCLNLGTLNAMDHKSSPARHTHHKPTFRGGVMDSSDDSVSGSLENLTWQKGLPQSTGIYRRHHNHNRRIAEAESHNNPAEKIQSFAWDPKSQCKAALVNFKGEPSDTKIQSSRSARSRVAKRHFVNVQRPSPIMECNGDLEEDSDEQFSHQKDIQHCMVKCHSDLMKEFKSFKLSLSRQIVNLQLDVDKILANQEAASSNGFQGLSSHHRPRSAAQGSIGGLADENQELPAYSSLKFRQESMNSASLSSGESYPLPSSKLESRYAERCQRRAHFDTWPQDEGHLSTTSQKSDANGTHSHVYRNLQNNPIYIAQTSDKREPSRDSDTSESSIDLTQLNYREAMGTAEQGRSTYHNREEPRNQQNGKAVAEERQPTNSSEEDPHYDYDQTRADLGRPTYSSQHYRKADAAEKEEPIHTREEHQKQQRAGVERGRPTHPRKKPQSRPSGKAVAEQPERTNHSLNCMIERHGEGEPSTLRGWVSAFRGFSLAETDIMTEGTTLQSASPKTGHRSCRESPTQQSVVQESLERERSREKQNEIQYTVHQFAGKSFKGGCAWTVNESASSPNTSQKGSPANGTTASKGRQKHYYPPADNH